MKKCKKLYCLFLTIILFALNLNVLYAITPEQTGKDVESLIKIINENYIGGEVDDEKMYVAAMKGLFQELDPYSEFFTPEEYKKFIEGLSGTIYGVGIRFEINNEGLIVVLDTIADSPAQKAGIKTGDIIIAVDSVDIRDLSLDEITRRITGEIGTNVTLTVESQGTTKDIQLKRDAIKLPIIQSKELDKDWSSYKVAKKTQYISVSSFSKGMSEDFRKQINDAINAKKDYLILDLRGNGGGFLNEAIYICNMIVPEGPVLYAIKKDGTEEVFNSQLSGQPFKKIAVLVDGNTASASEVLASAIQDSKAGVIIGERTYGKGVIQTIIDFKKYYVKLTFQEYLTRNKNKINSIGVKPNIEVKIPELIVKAPKKYSVKMKDEYVNKIETILNYLGYFKESPDELYTEVTELAVKKFQKDNKLYAYGVCDYTTQNKLNEKLVEVVKKEDPQLKQAIIYLQNNDSTKK